MPEAIFCSWSSWKHWNTHAYQVSPPCIVWCANLRSEEVVTGKSAWGNFLSMVVMETLKYTCVPSFTSMHCMVCKFEKWTSSYREKCLGVFLLMVVMETMEYTCARSFISMWTVVGKFEKGRSEFKENCLRLLLLVVVMETICVSGGWRSMCVYWVSFQYVLPLACYNDKQFYQETLPEAICCCLQTCLSLIFIPFIENIMYTKVGSHGSHHFWVTLPHVSLL